MLADKKCLCSLYDSFIHPYWHILVKPGVSIQKSSTSAILTQKRVVRIITFFHYLAHTQPLFLSLSIIPLDRLSLNQIVIVMYKYSNGLLPDVLNRLCVKNNDIHSYNTRRNNLSRIPRGIVNFTNISARVWSVLDTTINVYVPFYVNADDALNFISFKCKQPLEAISKLNSCLSDIRQIWQI